jgi:hypothetical protein
MMIKHFSHADKTREYIMAYLLSLPSSVEKSTRAITAVVEDNMRRDGLKPARSIGYLMRELERLGKVSRRGQQFWQAVRTPIEDGYSREQVQHSIQHAAGKIAVAQDLLAEALEIIVNTNEKMNEQRLAEQQSPSLETSQADDSGDKPADIKVDE